MASTLKSLFHDNDRYDKCFRMFKQRSNEQLQMEDFICTTLSDELASIGDGKSINVIGLGTGEGNYDIKILSQLRLKHPGVMLNNEVVEPSTAQIQAYKERVAQVSHLDPVKFAWNEMTSSEFEEQWRQRNVTKKVDFIHMIQVLYYIEDPGPTIRFYQSLLKKNGKLMITLQSGEGDRSNKWRELGFSNEFKWHKLEDITKLLDEAGIPYQCYGVCSDLDITECFTEGDETGEMILDFITQTVNFSKTAPSELRERPNRASCEKIPMPPTIQALTDAPLQSGVLDPATLAPLVEVTRKAVNLPWKGRTPVPSQRQPLKRCQSNLPLVPVSKS
ncbi:histamine N-methyltransferase-like [Periophthalmus magnuspinnatus]|uniref:histamine N-methyltransferase-like n=1 Tax=Periophthalmus magnuspinnatus TaxID=409849 RepID=UPI002436D7F3|nr:histamine N-methyltransferase-like [Periophthalmus magnuspinnatus]